jgi:nucleotide-binding universal stress UspA family protein
MITTILVPIDYSEASHNALETAIAIAGRKNAAIQLLQVNDIAHPYDAPSLKKAKQVCYAMADSIHQRSGIATEVIFAEGYIGPTIVKTAVEVKPSLIIMGAYGASGHRDFFIGSNAYYVIKYAACPVLTIPEGGKWLSFQKMLLPVRPTLGRFKRHWLLNDLTDAAASPSELEVFGVSVERKEQDVKQVGEIARELNHYLNNAAVQVLVSYSEGKNVAEEVLEKADKTNADLIIVSTTVDVSNKQFFVGPFSQRIINHARIPVLCLLRSPGD